MGACASKFTVLKNASDAPPPAVKQEVESREVNPVEEVAVKKDDAASVEDEASRPQSLGHLLSEGEEKKGSAVADDEKTPDAADGIESKGLEEAISHCQNVGTEAETVKLESKGEVETLKAENPEENKAAETLETKAQPEEVEEKPAEVAECGTSEKEPEALATEKTDEEKPTSDAENKEANEKSAEVEAPEKEPEVIEVLKPTSETEKKNAEEKPPENTKVVIPEEAEDKHVTTENCAVEEASEKPKAEEKANS